VVDVHRLRCARLAVVGLGTTTGQPPMIVEAAVYQLTGRLITAGPFTYWAGPDVPLDEIPARCWPNLRFAPRWAEVADRLLETLVDRTVVVHEPDQLAVLRRHLPGWQPAAVAFTRELAEQAWPGLSDYGLYALASDGTDDQFAGVWPGAAAEAQAITLIVRALLPPRERTVTRRTTGTGSHR